MSAPKRVLVAGASGYTGALAAALVQRHPDLEVSAITSRSDVGTRLDALYPHHRVPLAFEELDVARHAADADAAIVAYPHGASAPVVAELHAAGLAVVDLSADFRLDDRATYERWYGEHGAPEAFGDGVYGLPELHREHLHGARLVAGPGCFPTAALLALAPLPGLAEVTDVVLDAKTGISGAGRKASAKTHFVSADENVTPYGAGATHRHLPEIEQELGKLGHGEPITFVPHLVPLDQGELISAYVKTARPVQQDELEAAFAERYAGEPFVELASGPPGVRAVRDTNYCRISVHAEPRTSRVVVFSAIDNLWKGSSSQAIQCLNLMLGLDETAGLL